MKDKRNAIKITACLSGIGICLIGLIFVARPMVHQGERPAVTTSSQAIEETVSAQAEAQVWETLDWDAILEREEEQKNKEILSQYEETKQEIPDLVGWVKIDGTGIDYPVVQRDDEFYMNHDPYGNDDVYGAIFMEQVNDYMTPDNNLMIYGHNRKDAKMFGELMEYEEEDYYREHPVIHFNTLYEEGEYEIIAIFKSKVYYQTDTVFKYYQFFGSNDPDEFQSFVDNVKELSLYPIEESAEFGDELITLSTCEYSVENGRFAIVAKRVKEEDQKQN